MAGGECCQAHCRAGRGEPCAHFWGALFFQGSAGLSSSGAARSPLSALAAFFFRVRLVFHRSALFSRLGWVFLAAMAASRLHSAPWLFFQGSAGLAGRPKACARLPPASDAKRLERENTATASHSCSQPPPPATASHIDFIAFPFVKICEKKNKSSRPLALFRSNLRKLYVNLSRT